MTPPSVHSLINAIQYDGDIDYAIMQVVFELGGDPYVFQNATKEGQLLYLIALVIRSQQP